MQNERTHQPPVGAGPDNEHGLQGLSELQATFDLAPIGLAQFDTEGRFLRVNDRLCEILGCSRGDVLATTFQAITFPDDLPQCLALTARLAAREIPSYSVDKRFIRPDGSIVWARITVSTVRRADGTVIFFIGAAEDISEQIAAAEALHAVEERLHTALDASMIGTFRFDVRRNTLEWADGFDRVFGTSDNRTLAQFYEVVHPDDRAHVMAAYQRTVDEGLDFEQEFRVIWPDGTTHWLHDRGRTVLGEDGRPTHIVGAVTDISNHKRMQQVISEGEAQFRTLANTIPQLAWISRNDGSRTWFNDRWIDYTGLNLEQLKGFGWMRVHYSRDDADAVLARQRACFRTGSAWEDTVRLRRNDGEYRWFLALAMPVRGDDGSVTEWFGTDTDITDRLEAERAQEELLQQEHAARLEAERATAVRNQVLGFVAHDLRNPLQAMIAASAVLELPTVEQRLKPIEVIKRSARSMDRLITDLLDVSRMESGTFDVKRDRVDTDRLLSDVIEGFHEHARARDVQLLSDVDANTRYLEGDPQRLAQALSNLVGNAIKFTAPGGRVVVGARQHTADLEIIVQDTGCGIAPENLPSIFDRFWQADRTSGGAGLGLAIVKGIVAAHHGQIDVESTVDSGTTFHLHLPSNGGSRDQLSQRTH